MARLNPLQKVGPQPHWDDAVLTVCRQIAHLQRRIERLQQEQNQLVRRFHELKANTTAPAC